jgi:galactokinase
MTVDTADIKQKFTQTFGPGGKIRVIRAPGRVNLIGEHTDYNDGFVFPMAIEPHVLIACRARSDGKVRLASTYKHGEVAEFSVNDKLTPGNPKWANYSKGVAAGLIGVGIPLVGMDAMIDNTLPVGGGLSSSAAIEVGTARALLSLVGEDVDPMRIALISQKAEHEFANVPCGIMDQTIVAKGTVGHAMLLDCRDLSTTFIPIDANELRVVITNSMAKHELSGGEYRERREQCEAGVKHFQKASPSVKALRDVTLPQVNEAKTALPDVIFRRCRHVVSENTRCTQFADLLVKKEYEAAGKLMEASHNSLRDDYEVSTPELDFLVGTAMNIKGVYGSRMTGGGFGGCTVSLVQPRAVEGFIAEITKAYQVKYNIQTAPIVTIATAGASVIE